MIMYDGLSFQHLYSGMEVPVEDSGSEQVDVSVEETSSYWSTILEGLQRTSKDVLLAMKQVEGMTGTPTVLEALESLKQSYVSLTQEETKVKHMMSIMEMMSLKIEQLEFRLKEMTYVLRAKKYKSIKPKRSVLDDEMWKVYHRASAMLLGGNDISERMALNEINGVHQRAIELFHSSKPEYRETRYVLQQKKKKRKGSVDIEREQYRKRVEQRKRLEGIESSHKKV